VVDAIRSGTGSAAVPAALVPAEAGVTLFPLLVRTAALEHFQHAVGDEEASDYIAGGGYDGDHA
jgi:hypothetical protein